MSKTSKGDSKQKGAKVGLISRIDYGSSGFRRALIDAAFDRFNRSGTHYNVLAGGLVAKTALTGQMKDFVKSGAAAILAKKDKSEKIDRKELTQTLEDKFLKGVAQKLAKIIPVLTITDPLDPAKKKSVDLYIVTSPAFDGDIGERVALMLTELRPDIMLWNQGGDRFPVLYAEKLLWVLTPLKGVWMRGDYFSTAVERLIKDKVKSTTQYMPDLFVVGCLASSINKPKGELPYAYVSVPACHRLEETRVAENQIGVIVLEFPENDGQYIYKVYSFKDLVAKELSFIGLPSKTSSVQKKIIERTKLYGWVTLGTMKYAHSELDKEEIFEQAQKLAAPDKEHNYPGLHFQEKSKKFYFDRDWIQDHLKYEAHKGAHQEDRIVGFCCLHAGSIETDYEFFVNAVPEIILKHHATRLVNCGDVKEGLKHDLDKTGQIIAGMNNTQQEKFAAHLHGGVILKVFKTYFSELAAKHPKKKLDIGDVCQYVSSALIEFDYRTGNHDDWETRDGHETLKVFHSTLIAFLYEKITEFLAGLGLKCDNLYQIVSKKIIRTEFFELVSGLKVSLLHPGMARSKTTSLRLQEMLGFAREAHIVLGGNFHVGEMLAEWDPTLGQRVCVEYGTIKHGSDFERGKMKTVDQGAAYLGVHSIKDVDSRSGKDVVRIVMTESAFYGGPRKSPVSNADIINGFITSLGVDPIRS